MESKNIILTFEKEWYNSDSAALMEAALHIEIDKNKMKSRNITLTLEKAREWYNSGSADLKEVALQAYKEEELEETNWEKIKTFEDAYRALGVSHRIVRRDLEQLNINFVGSVRKHLIATYKLGIIRKALNRGWNPKMTKDIVYCPCIRFYPANSKSIAFREETGWRVQGNFKADSKEYSLLGGDYYCCNNGLGNFSFGSGDFHSGLGSLACKNEEIAKHMSRYFAKEIFEAYFARYVGAYEWV